MSLRKKELSPVAAESIVPEQREREALQPHKYPVWVISFASLVILSFLYSLFLIPKYLITSKKLNYGNAAYQMGKYADAIEAYSSVLKLVPSSKVARMKIAEAYFSNDNEMDNERGIYYLEGLSLNDNEWNHLKTIIPKEYEQRFVEVSR